MVSPLRVALCGLGDAGRLHGRALAACNVDDRVTWTAIAGRDEAGVARFRESAAVPETVRGFASLDALLDSGCCDAVILATPDGLHAEQAIRCASRGLHVLVEKPLALTAADAAAVVAAAQAADVLVDVGYHLRHHAGHRVVKARLAELVGAPLYLSVSWSWPDPATTGWRARGEGARFWSLAALGTHAIDLITWFTGSSITHVVAITEPPTGLDRAAVIGLALHGAALAQVSCAVTHRAPSRVLIAGDVGEIECLDTLGAHGAGEILHRPVTPRAAVIPLPFAVEDPYRAQLRAFAARIAAGGARTAAAELVGNVEVLDRIEDARQRSRGTDATRS